MALFIGYGETANFVSIYASETGSTQKTDKWAWRAKAGTYQTQYIKGIEENHQLTNISERPIYWIIHDSNTLKEGKIIYFNMLFMQEIQ